MATIPSTERRTKAKSTTAMLHLATNRGDLDIPPTVLHAGRLSRMGLGR